MGGVSISVKHEVDEVRDATHLDRYRHDRLVHRFSRLGLTCSAPDGSGTWPTASCIRSMHAPTAARARRWDVPHDDASLTRSSTSTESTEVFPLMTWPVPLYRESRSQREHTAPFTEDVKRLVGEI